MKKDVIIALDFPNMEEVRDFLKLFGNERPFVKIGMELFYGEGPKPVKELAAEGYPIFLDLKLHDIPNTVERAMKNLRNLGAKMTNVHAAGGIKMMEAARAGFRDGLLIAVTQLTSSSQQLINDELMIEGSINEVIKKYAQNTKEAGLDGVVCSPLEAGLIHEACGENFLTITPGIRFADNKKDDQVRVCDPARARQIGSDYIVVGRSITAAPDPVLAYKKCLEDFLL